MRVNDIQKVCGTCKYYQHEDITDGYVCVNPDSYHCADWVDKNDCCIKWSEKESENE